MQTPFFTALLTANQRDFVLKISKRENFSKTAQEIKETKKKEKKIRTRRIPLHSSNFFLKYEGGGFLFPISMT